MRRRVGFTMNKKLQQQMDQQFSIIEYIISCCISNNVCRNDSCSNATQGIPGNFPLQRYRLQQQQNRAVLSNSRNKPQQHQLTGSSRGSSKQFNGNNINNLKQQMNRGSSSSSSNNNNKGAAAAKAAAGAKWSATAK